MRADKEIHPKVIQKMKDLLNNKNERFTKKYALIKIRIIISKLK